MSAFGLDGYHLLVEVPDGCIDVSHTAWDAQHLGNRYYQAAGQVVEYWFLDVDGTVVLVEANTLPESPEEDVAELQAVLDTLVVTP